MAWSYFGPFLLNYRCRTVAEKPSQHYPPSVSPPPVPSSFPPIFYASPQSPLGAADIL